MQFGLTMFTGILCDEEVQSNSQDTTRHMPYRLYEENLSDTDSSNLLYNDFPDHPIQLIRPDPLEHRNLEIIGSNVKYLHHLNTTVAVVAVVGKFHSGKSFLLNQLMGKQEGFGIGPSVNPQTMGIWMWGKVKKSYSSNSLMNRIIRFCMFLVLQVKP